MNRQEGNRVKISGILEDEKEMVSSWYPGRFIIENLTGTEATIFIMPKDLMELTGRKYHGKRNHIARFKDNSSWNYEKLSSANGRMYPDEPYLEEKTCG